MSRSSSEEDLNRKAAEASGPPPPYPGQPQPAYPTQAPYATQAPYPTQPPAPAAYPPAGEYPPSGPQPALQQTTVVTQVVTPAVVFRQTPLQVICPHCSANVTTKLDYASGAITYLVAGGLCIFGCWLGCCLIPFCVNDLQEVVHLCPNCNREIGRYTRL